MIVELANEACRQLDDLDALEIAKKEANDIHATLKELANIKTIAIQLSELCSLLSGRLPLRDIQSVEIPKILKSIQGSHAKFSHDRERRQVPTLRDIVSKLQALVVKIEGLWRKYAESLVNPHFELLDLVRYLPEVREQEAILNGLKNHLQHYAAILPRTEAELLDFDQKFDQLKSRLANLENLHPDVRSFLRKAYNHQATVADLTDEVIQWCRQGEHAKVFQISFVH